MAPNRWSLVFKLQAEIVNLEIGNRAAGVVGSFPEPIDMFGFPGAECFCVYI